MSEIQSIRVVARVVVQNQQGEVLLCRSRNGRHWVPPGGTLDPGETLSEAAEREVLEESGLRVQIDRLIALQEHRPPGRQEHLVEVIFLARPLAELPAQSPGAVESGGPTSRPWAAWFVQDPDGPRREVRWTTRDQLLALVDPVYPVYIRQEFWERPLPAPGLYLGLTTR